MTSLATYDRREVRGRYTLVEDIVKAHILEERLSFDIFRVILS
jgi:hypothetical protein